MSSVSTNSYLCNIRASSIGIRQGALEIPDIMVCLSPQASAFGEVPWRSPMSLVSTNSYLCHIQFHRHSVRCLGDPRGFVSTNSYLCNIRASSIGIRQGALEIPDIMVCLSPQASAFGKVPWRSPMSLVSTNSYLCEHRFRDFFPFFFSCFGLPFFSVPPQD